MYSIYNKEKSVVVERFITTLKTKIYSYMTSRWKHVYIDKLDDIVNKYNNTYHRTIKMKPVDVKDNTCIDSRELHSAEMCSTSCIQRSCSLIKTLMIKIPNLKLVIMYEFPSTKTFLLKDAHKIGPNKFL